MKKQYILSGILTASLMVASTLSALTDADIQKQAGIIGSAIFNNRAIAEFYSQKPISPSAIREWNNAFSQMQILVTIVINENKTFGMRSSTLTKALDKIMKAEIDIINPIKITHDALTSPTSMQKQITILNTIKEDMIAVNKTLQHVMTPTAKNEARKLLRTAASTIEAVASRTIQDAPITR